jgi:hypothetical protein
MTEGSTRQHVKALTTTAAKQKLAGNSMQCSNVKAPTKKAIKNHQKWPASESDDDTSLNKEPKEQHPCKKTKCERHKADADIKEVGDTEESEEVEEVNDDEASVSEKVSY